MIRPLSVFVVLVVLAGPVSAAPPTYLEPQLNGLLTLVGTALNEDIALKGQTVSLGLFGSETRPDSNYGPELKRIFQARFKEKLVAVGAITLLLKYDFAEAHEDVADGGKNKMQVLLLRVFFLKGLKELWMKSIEVNDSADILRVFGIPAAPPETGNQDDRNKAVEKALNRNQGKQPDQVQPTFQVKNGTQIGNLGMNRFFVEVFVKDSSDGPAKAIKPTANPLGNAFVDIKPNQFYEIVIHNNDGEDCVAQITVDGQDAMNRFNADGVKYPGLLIEKGKAGRLRGWFHTAKPRSVEKDNVFAFAVTEYGQGKDAVKATGEVGVITIQFAVAWKEGENRPAGRNTGRGTEKGPGLGQDFKVEPRYIGGFNDTIAVRYSPTAK